ncbi:hypothetical protein [Filomicrobium sp.]|nr:hypothetical protein [Filomicrobium sp.]
MTIAPFQRDVSGLLPNQKGMLGVGIATDAIGWGQDDQQIWFPPSNDGEAH